MDDLELLRKAVEDNPLEDAPLAALVDELQEQGCWWEAGVWRWELEERRRGGKDVTMLRQTSKVFLAVGPEGVVQLAEFGRRFRLAGGEAAMEALGFHLPLEAAVVNALLKTGN